jgi:hypothetical protein
MLLARRNEGLEALLRGFKDDQALGVNTERLKSKGK